MEGLSKQDFLRLMAKIESSNGANTNHRTMTTGMHKGTHAIGNYGLMPLTVNDLAKNQPDLANVVSMSPEDKNQYLLAHPELQDKLAGNLYDRISAKTTNPEIMRYMWLHGQNTNPNNVSPEKLAADSSVQEFKVLKQNLGMKDTPENPYASLMSGPAKPKMNPVQQNIAEQTDETKPSFAGNDNKSIMDFINDPRNPFNQKDEDESTSLADSNDEEDDDLMKKYANLI